MSTDLWQKKNNDQLNTTLGDTLKELALVKKIADKRSELKMESKKVGADIKEKVEPKKQRVASSQTKPAKKIAKANQTKPVQARVENFSIFEKLQNFKKYQDF